MKIKSLILCLSILLYGKVKSQTYPYVIPNKDFVVNVLNNSGLDAQGVASAVDYVSGAVYTCGFVNTASSGKDLVLVKFDSTGVQQWIATYDFNSLDDRARALYVDGSGNVFVTGFSEASSGNKDIVTIKYNSSGTQQWASRFNGSNNTDDEGYDILVDGSGNIWVCGYATITGKGKDYQILKYNSSGTLLAQPKRSGNANLDDIAEKMDISGTNLFVTGLVKSNTTNGDIYTLCLNTTSVTLTWSLSVNGSANNDDSGYDIRVDNGDVYVCGKIHNTTTNSDYYFARLNQTTGAVKYSNNYDGGYNGTDYATSLVPDGLGKYAITGLVANGSNTEYHTRLYDTSSVLWTHTQAINANYTAIAPKIATDTIAQHFYVCGTYSNTTLQGLLYQLTPSGTKSWTQYHDGNTSGKDAFLDLVLDGIGRIYLPLASETSTTSIYNYQLARYSQTPMYYPIDSLYEEPNIQYMFYENKGQIIKSNGTTEDTVVFMAMDAYPFTYVSTNRISYKLVNKDTLGADTVQRIDINMIGSKTDTQPYPMEHEHGYINIFDDSLGSAITNIKGFHRYMVPNIYKGIDLHYYSNESGLKVYYVIKPFSEANPNDIKWSIKGATSSTVVSNNLEISGFNYKVKYDQPYAYQVDYSANIIPLATSTWTTLGVDTFAINTSTYNPLLPLVIELDYGNTTSSPTAPIGNIEHMTYYGGSLDEGFRIVKVDKRTGFYVAVGSTRSYDAGKEFPTIVGSNISTSVPSSISSNYLTVVLFDSLGRRKSANIYGSPGFNMDPIGAILKDNWITIIGNTSASSLPLYSSATGNLTPSTYSHASGPGYVIQFEYDNLQSMNRIKWRTFLNGYATGISMKPKSKEIYITGLNTGATYSGDYMYKYGALNNTSLSGNLWQNQLFKFDSSGVRVWCSQFPTFNSGNSTVSTLNEFNPQFPIFSSNTNTEYLHKCKIDCDDYGFTIAGEVNVFLTTVNKYGANIQTSIGGSNDGFVARFNSKDSIVFSTYIGGSGADAFTDVKITGPNEITTVGYSFSSQYNKVTYLAPSSSAYIDSTAPSSYAKILINKFDSIGNRRWGTYFGNGTKQAVARSITQDNQGKIYITGNTTTNGLSYPITNPSSVYNKTSALGTEDAFMISFDSTENVLWNTLLGGTYVDVGLSLDWNPKYNRLMIAGITNTESKPGGTIPNYFPTTSASSTPPYVYNPVIWYNNAINSSNGPVSFYFGPSDGFIGWFTVTNLVGIKEYFKDLSNNESFTIFPNPATENINLAFKNKLDGAITIEIYNQLGQLLLVERKNSIMPNSIISIKTSGLADGLYFVNVKTREGMSSKKFILVR